MKYVFNLLSYSLPFTLFLGVGLFISVKGKFFWVQKLIQSFPLVLKAFLKQKNSRGITSYSAACTAISATVGTGNIAGVAAAITLGGPGAVFWMWITSFIGMALKYYEIYFAVKHREKRGDAFCGGPTNYIKHALKKGAKPLSVLFALTGVFSAFTTGNITQANSISVLISNKNQRLIFGIILSVLTFVIISGGAKKICRFTEKAVPLMAVAYTLLTFGVIGANIGAVPKAFAVIFKGAFSPAAVTGGTVNGVMVCFLNGAAKGVFSNEAGLGTSATAHAAAVDANPKTQGLYGVFEVFLDTMFICTLTSLTILLSGVNIEYGSVASSGLVANALSTVYGGAAHYVLLLMMAVFGFSSIVGWAMYLGSFLDYLWGFGLSKYLKFFYPVFCFAGTLIATDSVWKLSEFFTGLMLIINLPVILILFAKENGEKNDNPQNRANKRNFKRKSGGINF